MIRGKLINKLIKKSIEKLTTNLIRNWPRTQIGLEHNKKTKTKYIWVVKYYKLDIVKFSSTKRLFKSSRWVIQLHGLSCSSFNRTVPLTVKNKNIFLLICSFLHSFQSPLRDTSYQLWIAVLHPENLYQLDLDLLNPSWPSSSVHGLCSKEILLLPDRLLRRWHDSVFSSQISPPICCKTLHAIFSNSLCTIELDMPIISTHSLQEYCAFSNIDIQGKLPITLGHRSLFYHIHYLIQAFWS